MVQTPANNNDASKAIEASHVTLVRLVAEIRIMCAASLQLREDAERRRIERERASEALSNAPSST